jgi:hypothetical protein
MRIRLLLVVLAWAPRLAAQDDLAAPARLHEAVRSFIDTASRYRMPAGDTLLSWSHQRPVLFLTAGRDSAGIHAGLLRADRMIGIADVRLAGSRPLRFHVRWLGPLSPTPTALEINGEVRSDSITITGTRDTTFVAPGGRWAVADYGMEQLLAPALEGLADGDTASIIVLRPYGLKWDTLHVAMRVRPDVKVLSWGKASSEQWWLILDDRGRMLWLRRSKYPDAQVRPLPLSPLAAEFDGLRAEMDSVSGIR